MSCVNSKKGRCSELFKLRDWIPEFLIDNVTREALCFRENLVVSLKDETDTKPIGGYCISVEIIGAEGREFLVHVLSSMTVDDRLGGSKMISSTTEKFHCLEEKRTEFVYKDDGLHKKILYMGTEDDFYHVETTQIYPCNKFTQQEDLPHCCYNKLISEGANVLLMRYLAIINFHGTLSFESLTIEGHVTTCKYNCSAVKRMKINDRSLNAYTIERIMHEECGTVRNVKIYMTKQGRILKYDWLDTPYVLQINPMIDPRKIVYGDTSAKLSSRKEWSEDMEMISKYLDKKTCKMAQQTEYLADHPEIKQLIADYAQALIIVKPVDVLTFTIQHFKAFTKYPERYETSLSSKELVTDVISQLSKYKSRQQCNTCKNYFDCKVLEQSTPKLEELENPVSATCSVFSQCPSDASCIKRPTPDKSVTITCFEDCKICKREEKECSICSIYSEYTETCEGCHHIKKPCEIQKACPECPGCRKVCDQFGICPNCQVCNIEILPDTEDENCLINEKKKLLVIEETLNVDEPLETNNSM